MEIPECAVPLSCFGFTILRVRKSNDTAVAFTYVIGGSEADDNDVLDVEISRTCRTGTHLK